MGIKLLGKIVAKGQHPVAIRVISYLGWLDFALLSKMAGPQCPELIHLSQTMLQKILAENTPLTVNFVGELSFHKTNYLFLIDSGLKKKLLQSPTLLKKGPFTFKTPGRWRPTTARRWANCKAKREK